MELNFELKDRNDDIFSISPVKGDSARLMNSLWMTMTPLPVKLRVDLYKFPGSSELIPIIPTAKDDGVIIKLEPEMERKLLLCSVQQYKAICDETARRQGKPTK